MMKTKIFKISFLLFGVAFLSSCSIFSKMRNSDNPPSVKAPLVVQAAKKKMGAPYKYGGATSAGYDCSGLVFTSFDEANIRLPRTSVEQANVGKDIAMEKVRPGDLVFFATKKGEGKISHVGIVTEVKTKEVIMFIHAANTGVQEDNLYAPYYFNSFVKAKRPY